jgi:translation initiation factor IF-3
MDYGKYKYEEAQRAKESRRKSSNVSIKEMKYRPKIGTGDFDTKTRKIAEFLSEGHKVKVTIMFRGREMQHPELGMKILTHVADEVAGEGKIEAAPKIDGRNMIMVLAPEKKAKPKPARPEAAGLDAETAPAHASEDSEAPPPAPPTAPAPPVEAQAAETTTAPAQS